MKPHGMATVLEPYNSEELVLSVGDEVSVLALDQNMSYIQTVSYIFLIFFGYTLLLYFPDHIAILCIISLGCQLESTVYLHSIN